MKVNELLNEVKTAFLRPGLEVIIGSSNYRQYATVQRIEGEKIYLSVPGKKKVTAYNVDDIEVEIGRKFVPAKLPLT